MRHRIYGRHLNRTPAHRRAMLRNLAAGLFEHGQIETTLAKAKAVQPFVEKIITIAKQGTLSARRQIEARINDRKIHVWVADPNVPDSAKDNDFFELPDASEIEFNRYGEVRKAPRLVQHIMTVIAPKFADRNGGYTRITRTGRHRLGDGTDIVILQLVGEEDGPEIGGGVSTRRQRANNRAAFAARLRKDGAGAEPAQEQPAPERSEPQEQAAAPEADVAESADQAAAEAPAQAADSPADQAASEAQASAPEEAPKEEDKS